MSGPSGPTADTGVLGQEPPADVRHQRRLRPCRGDRSSQGRVNAIRHHHEVCECVTAVRQHDPYATVALPVHRRRAEAPFDGQTSGKRIEDGGVGCAHRQSHLRPERCLVDREHQPAAGRPILPSEDRNTRLQHLLGEPEAQQRRNGVPGQVERQTVASSIRASFDDPTVDPLSRQGSRRRQSADPRTHDEDSSAHRGVPHPSSSDWICGAPPCELLIRDWPTRAAGQDRHWLPT